MSKFGKLYLDYYGDCETYESELKYVLIQLNDICPKKI